MNGKRGSNDRPKMPGTPGKKSLAALFFDRVDRRKSSHSIRFMAAVSPSVLLLASIFCISSLAVAADWRLVPSIGLAGGYDDNIFFDRDNKVDSSIIDITPGVELDYNSLLSTLRLTADYNILRYLDESDLDRVNQYYQLDGTHQMGQRWNTRAELRYNRDTTLNTYLEETGRVIDRVDRDFFSGKGGLNYAISTVSAIDTEYQYEKAEYEDNQFPKYSRHRLNLRYQHRLKSQQDVLSIGPSFYHRRNDLNNTNYAALDFGWERDWSEITNTYASIGARYTNVDPKSGDDENDWGATARFDLTHRGIASTITFEYYHDLATSAFGADINVDNFYLKYSYLLTARFGVGIDGRLVFSYDLFDKDDEEDNSRYFEVQPFTYYRLTEKLYMYLRYSYQNSSQDLFKTSELRQRNRIWIEFQYQWPMML